MTLRKIDDRATAFDVMAFDRGLSDYATNAEAHDAGAAHCYGTLTRRQAKGAGADAPQWRTYYSAWEANKRSDGTVVCAAAECGERLTVGDAHRAHQTADRKGGCYCGVNLVLTHAECNHAVEVGHKDYRGIRSDWVTAAVLLSGKAIKFLYPDHPAGDTGWR